MHKKSEVKRMIRGKGEVLSKRFKVLKVFVLETDNGPVRVYPGDVVQLNRHAIVINWLTGRIQPVDLPARGKFRRPSGEVVEMSWDQALEGIRTNTLAPYDDFDFLGLKG